MLVWGKDEIFSLFLDCNLFSLIPLSVPSLFSDGTGQFQHVICMSTLPASDMTVANIHRLHTWLNLLG